MSEDEFKRYVADPVKKKYPNITVEMVDFSKKGFTLPELVATNTIPDIYVHYPSNLFDFMDLGLGYSIEELIKQQKFDLNRIKPEFLETIKLAVSKDYLTGLPIDNNAFGLFYNKSLFDQFGVSYPKDNMTWDDVKGVAVRLNRNVSGVQYLGLHPDSVNRGARQLALPYIDVKNDKPVFQAQWKELFDMWASLYKIQGGDIPKGLSFTKGFYDGTIAMIGGYSFLITTMNKTPGLQWDVVTYPTSPKAPGVGSVVDSLVANITSTSKHKPEAFQVLSVILSDDVQIDMGRQAARMSVLKDANIQSQFGKGVPELQSKNVVALTKLKLAPLQPYKYTFGANPATIINNAFNAVVYDGKDANTALREADELMNQEIQKALNK
jgi:multiple sugar transport system substrate-binding protein